jgi:hypothetical protein
LCLCHLVFTFGCCGLGIIALHRPPIIGAWAAM